MDARGEPVEVFGAGGEVRPRVPRSAAQHAPPVVLDRIAGPGAIGSLTMGIPVPFGAADPPLGATRRSAGRRLTPPGACHLPGATGAVHAEAERVAPRARACLPNTIGGVAVSNDALDRSMTDPGAAARYAEVQKSPEFVDLRRRFRKFVFTLTALFLAWYFLYVLMSSFAVEFMSRKVVGEINVGLIFGLLQFVSTFAITIAYVRWADRHFDPAAEQLRDQIEGAQS